jgi:ABC-2 type transport system permease protein
VSTAPLTPVPAHDHAVPGALHLAVLHARYQFLETVRVPIAVIGTTVFPAVSLLFFVVPQPFADDPVAATAAAGQLALFAVMSVCLFTYGVGVAEDRALPWDTYLRTLPVGPVPRLLGRLVNGLAFVVIGLVPLMLIAATLTAATLPVDRLALTLGGLLLAGLPLFCTGIAIGYSLSTKAALAVAQSLLLPLAFGGGLFLPPELFPGWLDAVSIALPTRAGRDIVVAATTGADLPATALPVLALWLTLTGALAVWAYRRDEGQRFR